MSSGFKLLQKASPNNKGPIVVFANKRDVRFDEWVDDTVRNIGERSQDHSLPTFADLVRFGK